MRVILLVRLRVVFAVERPVGIIRAMFKEESGKCIGASHPSVVKRSIAFIVSLVNFSAMFEEDMGNINEASRTAVVQNCAISST